MTEIQKLYELLNNISFFLRVMETKKAETLVDYIIKETKKIKGNK